MPASLPEGLAKSVAGCSVTWGTSWVESRAIEELIAILEDWMDTDEPLIEAMGNTIAEYRQFDSQEQARRILSTVIEVLQTNLVT